MEKIKILSWIINNECNMRCIHCYPDSGIETKRSFSNTDFDKLYYSLSSVKFDRIYISGGEPTLDKDFFRYLELAKKISNEVDLCTNGTLISEDLLYKLNEIGISSIVISLQHCIPENAENIYQRQNVLNKVLFAMEKAKKYNFCSGFEITLLKQNYQLIDEFFEIAKEYNTDFISFKRFREIGRGKLNGNIRLSPEENYSTLKKIFQKQLENNNKLQVNVHDPLYITVIYDYLQNLGYDNEKIRTYLTKLNIRSCRAGTSWIGVDPLGNVSPCPLLLYADVVIGNIFNDPLVDILKNSEIIKKLHEVSKTSSNCKYSNWCIGCRTAAISKNNNLFDKDPMCIYPKYKCTISRLE